MSNGVKRMKPMFTVHDKVQINRMAFSGRSGLDVFEVVRLMPQDPSGEFTYRIKKGLREMGVKEAELRFAPPLHP